MVICDRYAFSGIAFSASKGLPYEWCRAPDISLPAPDLTLFLDITPEKAKDRGGYGQERYENEDMQKRVRGIFERIGGEMDVTTPTINRKWVKVDAGQEKDAVATVVWGHVQSLTAGVEGSLQRLWENCRAGDNNIPKEHHGSRLSE